MITSLKQNIPKKLVGCFPLSHQHNCTEGKTEAHFRSPNVFKENHEVFRKIH